MTTKHTKSDLFQTLLVLASATESEGWVIAGIEHEIALLAKRAGAKGTNAKRDAEQTVSMQTILLVMDGTDAPMRATAIAEGAGFSVQKVSALLRKMVAAGEVVREQDKKVTTFSLA